MIRRLTIVLAAIAVVAPAGVAQGTLGSQGFGYPPGQLSARAFGAVGALAEFDAATPLNPAAMGMWGSRSILMQIEPEYRRTRGDAEEDFMRIVRFPLFSGVLPVGSRLTLGVSASTLLDRTGETTVTRTEVVSGEDVTFTERFRSSGAINDLRVGAAYEVGTSVRAGFALHAITGENRLFLGREFETPGFDTLSQQAQISYGGMAASAGVQFQPVRGIILAGSGRLGGRLAAYVDDEEAARASVPARLGVGVAVDRFAGGILAAHYSWEGWSSFEGLGSARVEARDTRQFGLGAELDGPRVMGRVLPIRGGARWRTLPFGVAGQQVDELALGGGFGVPLLARRSQVDVGLQHARRTGIADLSESAWTLSIALAVRP